MDVHLALGVVDDDGAVLAAGRRGTGRRRWRRGLSALHFLPQVRQLPLQVGGVAAQAFVLHAQPLQFLLLGVAPALRGNGGLARLGDLLLHGRPQRLHLAPLGGEPLEHPVVLDLPPTEFGAHPFLVFHRRPPDFVGGRLPGLLHLGAQYCAVIFELLQEPRAFFGELPLDVHQLPRRLVLDLRALPLEFDHGAFLRGLARLALEFESCQLLAQVPHLCLAFAGQAFLGLPLVDFALLQRSQIFVHALQALFQAGDRVLQVLPVLLGSTADQAAEQKSGRQHEASVHRGCSANVASKRSEAPYRRPPLRQPSMPVQRFLGSAWATVHGPSEPRRLWTSVLDAGFAGLAVSPGPRATDWAALRSAARDLPVRVAAVRVGNPLAEQSATATLGSAKAGERDAARAAVAQAVALGRVLGCPLVVFDLGVVPLAGEIEAEDLGDPNIAWTRERVDALLARRKVARDTALDRACREVYELVRAFPDAEFCLTANRSLRGLGDPAALRDLFDDLASLRLGYWHDAAVCARRSQVGLESQGEWLEMFANRCRGMTLGDASPDGIYLPPGAGGVDYGLLASYVPRGGSALPAVVELDAAVAASELPGIRSCLDKHGL